MVMILLPYTEHFIQRVGEHHRVCFVLPSSFHSSPEWTNHALALEWAVNMAMGTCLGWGVLCGHTELPL